MAVAVFVPDVVAAFKPGYEPIVLVCQVLCIAVPVRLFAVLSGALFRGLGRPRVDFEMNAWRLVILALGIAPVVERWGLPGLAWLVVAMNLAALPPAVRHLKDLAAIDPMATLRSAGPALYVSVVFGAAGWGIRPLLPDGFAWATLAGTIALAVTAGLCFVPRMIGLWDPVAELKQVKATLRPKQATADPG